METTIKAHGGDRAKNLEEIANRLSVLSPMIPINFTENTDKRTLSGLAEQLRIIAKEWRARQDAIERAEKAIAMYVNHEKEEMLVYAEALDCLRAVK